MVKAKYLVPLWLCLVLGVMTPPAAFGQMAQRGDTLQGLENRIQQLEYKLKQLRRDFDTGSGSTVPARPLSGFGAGGTPPSGNFAARVEIRMSELEREITRLTGQIEEQGFTVSSMGTRLDKLVEDIDFRLNALERGQHSGVQPSQSGVQLPSNEPPRNLAPAPLPGAGGPRSLGTISSGGVPSGVKAPAAAFSDPVAPSAQVASALPLVLPKGTPKEQYDFAYKLVRQGDYAEAEKAFLEFGILHPEDPLAGNAKYWLGETFYVRQDFVQAADAFIGVVTSYPDSPKRPHSMLKLGMSLLSMGQKQDGCATLGELLSNDNQDAKATRVRAESERKRAGCS